MEQKHNYEEANCCYCEKCHDNFVYFPDETFWDEKSGYSTKLTKCPSCGCINVIKRSRDYGVDVNRDLRFYEYSKK